MSIFSQEEMDEVDEIFAQIHNSELSREVTYYQTKEETVLATNPEHNFLFQSAPQNTTTQKVERSGTLKARILHGQKHSLNSTSYEGKDISNILLQNGEIRLKVDVAGNEILKESKKIIVDGFTCEIISAGKPIGPFSVKYYSYILKPIN